MQSWNSGSRFAMTDMLGSIWNFLAGNHPAGSCGNGGCGGNPELCPAPAIHAALIWFGLGSFLSVASALWKPGPGYGWLMKEPEITEVIMSFQNGMPTT